MKTTYLAALSALLLVAGCGNTVGNTIGSVTGSRTTVHRVGPDDLLKLRSGPGLEYKVVLGLPDGTALLRRECVTELGQQWCRVSLADAAGVSGYVSADYLR
ncbi:SH3 domain-containing protein [Tropicibacter sp. S64]|uniref:SH3 domain-containing protein n=1 Tax=Tropicibacter sp. S64 TaxID=3415122 RepID=UPI003C7D3D8A